MRLEELTILHLSDLHFGGNTSELVYTDLLSDVELLLRNINFLVILVSGDLVNQGVYKGNAIKVKRFFKKLKRTLTSVGIKKVEIEITAGNHDVVRPCASNNYNNKTYLPDLTNFQKLAKEVYGIFGVKNKSRTGITQLTHHGKRIFLIRIDSSFQLSKKEIRKEIQKDFGEKNLSESDKQKIDELSSRQLKEMDNDVVSQRSILQKDYARKVERLHNMRPALAIALSHYPLTWLNDTGREQVQDTLFKKGLAYVDVWISGHVHDVNSSYACENGKATVMLTTGIGRQEEPNTAQRYSIYRLCLDRNTSLVRVRRALAGRQFEDDPTFANKGSSNFHRLHILPLWSGPVGSIIRLNSPDDMQSAAFYIDDSAVLLVQEISKRIQIIRTRIAVRMREFVRQLANFLTEEFEEKSDVIQWISTAKNPKALPKLFEVINQEMDKNDWFNKFLKYICLEVVQVLKRDWGSVNRYLPHCDKDNVFAKIIWRAHFRYYLGHGSKNGGISCDSYKVLCSEDVTGHRNKVKNVVWGGVIKGAFHHPRRILVSSANYGLNETATKWDDFMTIIPNLPGNDINMNGDVDVNVNTRPLLTFGISVKGGSFEESALASKCLYILEYLNLCSVISEGIKEFIDITGFDYVKFLRNKANAESKTKK